MESLQKKSNSKTAGLILAIVSSATFGLVPLFTIPVLEAGIGANSLVFYRMIFAAVFMLVYILFKRISLKIELRDLWVVFLVSSLYAATSIFLTSSYRTIPSGVATTIHFLYPVVVALAMSLLFKEKLSFPIIISAIAAVAGVYFLCGGIAGGNMDVKGLCFVMTTVFTYAFYIISVNKSRCHKVNGPALTFYVLLFSAMFLSINALIQGQGHIDTIQGGSAWINLILLALIPTVVSNLTLVLAIKKIGSSITAILGCMEPLAAVLVGILVFGEKLVASQYLGAAVILFSVVIVLYFTSKNKK